MQKIFWSVISMICLSNTISFGQVSAERADSDQLQRLTERLERQEIRLNELLRHLSPDRTSNLLHGAVERASAETSHFRPLYTINRDGTDLRFLAAAPDMITTGTPQWSHDGKMIVLDSTPATDQVALSQIWVYGVAGAFRGMIRHLGVGNTPTWSPDDSRIAYMVNPGNPDSVEPGVWIMNADGTNKRRIGQGWYTRWSPDGQEICVQNVETNPHSLRLYSPENGTQREILGGDIGVMFGGANWSADGQKLITLVQRDGEQQLITIDASGDADSISVIYRESTGDRTLVGPPVLSPDGSEILFAIQEHSNPQQHTSRWSNTFIYVISADGTSDPRLLEGQRIGRINRSFDWHPDGSKIIFSSER